MNATTRLRRRKRAAVIEKLGGKCVHCGLEEKQLLQIDHIFGGGTREVRTIGAENMWKKILAGEPGYQLLCPTCNIRKRIRNKEHLLWRTKIIKLRPSKSTFTPRAWEKFEALPSEFRYKTAQQIYDRGHQATTDWLNKLVRTNRLKKRFRGYEKVVPETEQGVVSRALNPIHP